MNLRDLQHGMLSAVLNGTDFSGEGVTAAGMRVYANNVHGQMMSALRDTFEKTAQWLGDDVFEAYARGYIAAHRSSSWTLDTFGDAFPAHLQAACPTEPAVSELAWIDAALRRAFSGRDGAAVALAELVVTDWDQAAFRFVPTLAFRRLDSNAPALWAALAEGVAPPEPAMALPGSGVRVWRVGLTPQFTSMPPDELACLDLALAGGTLGDVCAWLAQVIQPDAVPARAGTLLQAWAADGLFTGLAD